MTINVEDDLTIVCASYNGAKRIPLFLDSIQRNSVRPKEVIICGTHESDISSVSDELLNNNNVSFIVSEFANQIYQRNLALSKVNTTFILQLDDDLILDTNVIANYCHHFSGPESNKKVVCGYPVLPNGQHMSFDRVKNLYQSSRFVRLFFKIMNGFKELKNMSILKSGRIFPLVLDGQKNIEPEWLSSCLMFHKDAMGTKSIIDSENNNTGKGYYEDVFFTLSLREKGFKLILDENIRMTHPYTSSIKPRDYLNTIDRQKKLLETTDGSYLLFYLDIFASFCFYTILHIKSKLLN